VVFSPILSNEGLPETEKYQAALISDLLARLNHDMLRSLSSDLKLLRHAQTVGEQATEDKLALHRRGPAAGDRFEEPFKYSQEVTGLADLRSSMEHWAHVATKDALLTVFNCREACVAVTTTLEQTRELRRRVDLDSAVSVRKEICDRVPDLRLMRNAVAHHGDHEKERATKYSEAADPFLPEILWMDRREQREVRPIGWGRLMVSNNGKRMQFTLDQDLVDDIERIVARFFHCFRAASVPPGT
jgi:hypothetical protein